MGGGEITLKGIGPAYTYYGKVDAIVREIKDPKTQALCDFFFFEVGHEQIFEITGHYSYSELEDESPKDKRTVIIEQPKNLDEACHTTRHF